MKEQTIYIDMESDAGEMGMEEFESTGKNDQYGGELNDVESKIEMLMIKRSNLELKLAR